MESQNHKENLRLEQLHKKLRKHLEEQSRNWKSFVYAQTKGFYQGFNEINLDGCRTTEKRFEIYKIEKYLSREKTVLDIGSNCGFFSLYVSRYVNHVDGVEINPSLISIANDTKEYLGIQNTTFHHSSFEDFKTEKKFDVVFSLANDSTIDRNTKFSFIEYIQKIINLLKKNGLLIFESQAEDVLDKQIKFFPKLQTLKEKFIILEDRIVESEYPINVPERIFLILKRK